MEDQNSEQSYTAEQPSYRIKIPGREGGVESRPQTANKAALEE